MTEQQQSECQLDDGGVGRAWQAASPHVSWVIYTYYTLFSILMASV